QGAESFRKSPSAIMKELESLLRDIFAPPDTNYFLFAGLPAFQSSFISCPNSVAGMGFEADQGRLRRATNSLGRPARSPTPVRSARTDSAVIVPSGARRLL